MFYARLVYSLNEALVAFTSLKQDATLAKFVPTPNNGDPQMIPVRRQREDNTHFAIFQKLKFVWDPEKKTFRGLVFPNDLSYHHYVNCKGHETEEQVESLTNFFSCL